VTKRVLVAALVAVVIAAGAAYALRSEDEDGGPESEPPPTLDEMAEEIGAPVMELVYRGHVAGRSGEIMLVPKPHHFLIGEWDPSVLLSATPNLTTSHPNPWNYIVRVPIILWGPRWISAGARIFDEVDITGLAPTYAELLGLEDFDAEGRVLPEALSGGTTERPEVIFTVVLDGGGWNALQQHTGAWPTIRRIGRDGTTYYNATIGSSPSITGALHATFGTGSYPRSHGIPGNQMRGPDGENTDAWKDNADPEFLRLPTVSELWDEATDNEAIVGTVSYEGWHLGMIGHGAQRDGADKDIAVLWEKDDNEWWINEKYYRLPGYLQHTNLARLESYERGLDGRDGIEDGSWYGHTLEELQVNNVRPGTPGFVRFTGDAVVDVIRNEDLGADDITDMIWIEMKMPDFAGHAWNMSGAEQEDVLMETDKQIARFIKELDRKVGREDYVFAISADHGQQPIPDLEGGWRINNRELERDLEAEFGPIVEKITPVDIYVDRDEVEAEGIELDEVAQFIAAYTLGENVPDELPSDNIPAARTDDLLFAGAFPTGYLEELTPEKIESFGDSEYPEGVLTVERGGF
jgi:hypothetical protein